MVTIALILSFICLGGAVLVLLGVWGAVAAQGRAMRELATDVASLEDRFMRDQKRRAGIEGRTGKGNLEEAQQLALSIKPTNHRIPILQGRASGRE